MLLLTIYCGKILQYWEYLSGKLQIHLCTILTKKTASDTRTWNNFFIFQSGIFPALLYCIHTKLKCWGILEVGQFPPRKLVFQSMVTSNLQSVSSFRLLELQLWNLLLWVLFCTPSLVSKEKELILFASNLAQTQLRELSLNRNCACSLYPIWKTSNE